MAHEVKLPMPGEILGPDYRVDCQLQNDGVMAVFGATSNRSGTRYTLRCFLADEAAEWAAATERFMRRARSAELFRDRKIVEIYAVQEDRGRFFAVSEWLEGQTLERYLQEHGPVPVDYALHLLTPCAEALAAAHRAGIVHGDVHPSNIFVCNATRTEVERALLQNFGYSELLGRTELAKQRGDQWRQHDERPSVQADIHAFGVTLYRTLGGPTPNDARNSARPSNLPRAQHIPPAIAVVVARALAVHPSERYTSLDELAEALIEYKRTRGAPKAARNVVSSQATLREIPMIQVPMNERDMLRAGMTVPGGWNPASRAKTDPAPAPAVAVEKLPITHIASTEQAADAVLGVGQSVSIARSPAPPPIRAQSVGLVPAGAYTWIRPAPEIAEIEWIALGDALDDAYSAAERASASATRRWITRLGVCVALLAWLGIAVEITARMRMQGKVASLPSRAQRNHAQLSPGMPPIGVGRPLSAAATSVADSENALPSGWRNPPPAQPTAATPQPSAAEAQPPATAPQAPNPAAAPRRPATAQDQPKPIGPARPQTDVAKDTSPSEQVRGDKKPLEWMKVL